MVGNCENDPEELSSPHLGLNDKEIEDKVTGLVKTGI